MKYSDRLDAAAAAIASAPRRTLLERVALAPATMSQLAAHLDVTLPAVDKHVRVLAEAGLIVKQKHGRVATVSLDAEGFAAVSEWIERTRAMWRANLASLADHLATTREERS